MTADYNHAAITWIKAYLIALGNGAEVWLLASHRPATWRRSIREQLRLIL